MKTQALTFEDLFRFADLFYQSGMFKDFTAQGLAVVIQYGSELGLGPYQSTQAVSIIGKQPAPKVEAMKGLCLASGKVKELRHELGGDGDDYGATVYASRNDSEVMTVERFTIKRAKKARLWGRPGPWQQYPDRMLIARAYGYACRDVWPDCVFGYTAEEVQDMTTESHSTQPKSPPPGLDFEPLKPPAVMPEPLVSLAAGGDGDADSTLVLGLPLNQQLDNERLRALSEWIDNNQAGSFAAITKGKGAAV